MITDETFFAWLDGELDSPAAARVASEIAADPQLSERVAQHRAMQARLKGAFDTLLDAPVPESLLATARAHDSEVINLANARRSRDARRRTVLPQWAALAATLAVGIFAGTMVPDRNGAPVEIESGRIYATAALGDALDNQLASAPRGDVRIGLTFRGQGGAICRSFTDAAASGLACRNGGRWQVRGLFGAPEGQRDSYRMAGGTDPNLAALIDATMIGEPFDADQEKAAQTHGWR
jgi:hypothetical protein